MIKTEKLKHTKSKREGESTPNPISTEQQILISKNKDLKKEVAQMTELQEQDFQYYKGELQMYSKKV